MDLPRSFFCNFSARGSKEKKTHTRLSLFQESRHKAGRRALRKLALVGGVYRELPHSDLHTTTNTRYALRPHPTPQFQTHLP